MDTTAELGEDKPRRYGRSSIQKVAAGFIPARLMLGRGIGSAVQGSEIKGAGVQGFWGSEVPFFALRALGLRPSGLGLHPSGYDPTRRPHKMAPQDDRTRRRAVRGFRFWIWDLGFWIE
jgi:hypothetical protein